MVRLTDRVLGLLDAALAGVPGAQSRPGQRAMVEAVDRALRTKEHLLVQAGTGTGKSLGYLVPALSSGRTVVVATATKALQAQLVDKDLPRLASALTKQLGRTPTFALAKGRSNYACLQQVHGGPGAVVEPDGLFETPASSLGAQVVKVREWVGETTTGDRDDVPFPVSDRVWSQVSVSARDCLGTRCPDRADCFAELAREQAKEADVVVANHALLALDAFTELSVLPEHDAVVLDEAHEFVASATEALTHELSRTEVRRALAAAKPLLTESASLTLQEASEALDVLLTGMTPGRLRRLPDDVAETLGMVQRACGTAVNNLAPGSDEDTQAARERARLALTAVADACAELLTPATSSAVYAVGEPGAVRLRVSPLSVGASLASGLFGNRTVVATSATLTLGGSFGHTARALGLSQAASAEVGATFAPWEGEEPPLRWRFADVGSPFDYPRQAQLYVADDLPSPSDPAWAAAVDARVVELVRAAGGRTLALFSSTAAAVRSAAVVRAQLDVPVLLQGEDSAGALTRRFAADARTCLFGTRSFWQGVDAPGSTCQLVIIDRIPFPHVEDPLMQARLEVAGPAGFTSVTLPPAAVLLAQGAGRLIRSTGDRGVVAVLDPRLGSASYSRLLRSTLPDFYPARSLPAVLDSLRSIDASAPPVQPVPERAAR